MMSVSSVLRLSLLLPAVALVALAVFFAHDAQPAAAQSAGNITVWSAALTAKSAPAGFGCDNGRTEAACSTTSILSDDDVTRGATTYTVRILTLDKSNEQVALSLGNTGDKLDDLSLQIVRRGTASLSELVWRLPLKDATHGSGSDANTFFWTVTTLPTIAANTVFDVSLYRPPPPPLPEAGQNWAAVLTDPDVAVGCRDVGGGGQAHDCATALTSTRLYIPWQPDYHHVKELYVLTGQLRLALDRAIPRTELDTLTLYVDGKRFHFEEGQLFGDKTILWDNSGLSWDDGAHILVGLEQRSRVVEERGAGQATVNPTGLRAVAGSGVLTLAWNNPQTRISPQIPYRFNHRVRWREQGASAWLNPQGGLGERIHVQANNYSYDITGLKDGTAYEAQVRVVRIPTPNAQGHVVGGTHASEWVPVTGTTLASSSRPAPTTITVTSSGMLREGGPPVSVFFTLDQPALAEGSATLGTDVPVDNPPGDTPLTRYWSPVNPAFARGATVAVMQLQVPEDNIDNNCRERTYSVTFPHVAGGTYLSAEVSFSVIDNDGAADTGCSGLVNPSARGGGQNSPCPNCGTGGDTGAVSPEQAEYADLIARMKEWRNDPQWRHQKSHTDRWDRALLAFGETVADTSLTAMTAAEAQSWADSGLTRWVDVAAALWEIEGGGQQQQPNQAPTVASAIADATIVSESGTQTVSLSGVFSDADGDSLSISAASDDEATATASVSSDGSSLTVTARLRGTATITVTADDGSGGRVSDSFTVTVKAAPMVSSAIGDVSGLEEGSTQDVSLSGVFIDADGDALTITASSNDEAVATVSVSSDGSTLTLSGVAEGTATITVIAQDSDGNRVMDDFDVSVVAQQQQQQDPPNQAPTVSAALGDITIVSESGTRTVSLSGVFSDADSDSLSVSAASSDETKATVSVATDHSSLAVAARARGTATITVTANDGKGGTVEDIFTVTVKAAPVVTSAIADMGLKAGAAEQEGGAQDVFLSGVFSDADGDSLTFTADTSNFEIADAFLFQGTLTVHAVAEGTATVTVTAQDSDGNRVSDAFEVSVSAAPEPDPAPTPTPTPEPTPTPTPTPEPEPETSDIVARYDANGNGKIDLSELQQAFSDYAAGKITYEEMLEVSNAYARQRSG